jgi:hypothetical protein
MTLEERISKLELFVATLTAAAKKTPPPQQNLLVADDELLARDWADMEIRKDPPRTQQPSHVGKRMSECTEAYLLDYASFHDWKAKKGREENPPRLNNQGKPWYERDELIAKLARGWALKVRDGTARTMNEIPF